ncbi:MAG TPA: nucleotide exchange factor GrpE [Streptosporangiaceae bacterium]|jgi:molecular chaperone GrpE
MSSPEETPAGPVIRDKRRIDPATGQVRNTGQASSGQPGGGPGGSGKPSRPGRHAASRPGSGPAGQPGAAAAGSPGTPGSGNGPGAGGQAQPAGQQQAATGAATPAATGQPSGNGKELADRLAERTADLQRVSAEYANYRKRVERDRLAVREQALANVLAALLPVLDDIGRAREHGELVGGFKSVADSLESATAKLGLVSFGDEGEPFDPNVHEALTHSYSADVTEPTCVAILQPGYKVGERILRPARVAVAEPEDPAEAATPAEPDVTGAEAQGNREEDN